MRAEIGVPAMIVALAAMPGGAFADEASGPTQTPEQPSSPTVSNSESSETPSKDGRVSVEHLFLVNDRAGGDDPGNEIHV